MKSVRRITLVAATMLGIGAASVIAAPVASAFTVAPAPDGGTVTLNQGEAAAVGNANIGGAVDAVLPGYANSRGESLGHALDRKADLVGRVPGANLDVTVAELPDPVFYIVAWK